MAQHIQVMHKELYPIAFHCVKCCEDFYGSYTLKMHLLTARKKHQRPVIGNAVVNLIVQQN